MRFTVGTILLLIFAGLIAGCGGGNSGTGSNGAAANATGRATFTVKWTQRSRLLPEAANSIRVEVKNGASTVASSLLSRPAQGGTSSATFSALPVGNLTITATAYPQADGTGTAQATATIPLVIAAGQDTPFSLTMASTIDHIEIAPTTLSLSTGLTATVTATAKDAAGAIVLLTPARTQWSSSNASAATVSNAGVVTAVGVGSTQVRFTDTESAKFAELTVTVRPNNPISFQSVVSYSVPFANDSVTAGDLDGDGAPDVIIGGSQEAGVLYGRGDGTLEPYLRVLTWDANVANREIADMNNDGRLDILLTDTSDRLVILYNQGNRTFSAPVVTVIGNASDIFVSDINGDGLQDVAVSLWGNGGSGSAKVFLNNGSGTFTERASVSLIGIVEGIYAADVNGDAIPDLAVSFETSTVDRSGVTIFYGNAQGTYTGGPTYYVGTQNMNSPRLADINGDGLRDLLVSNYWGANVVTLINAGDGTFGSLNRNFVAQYPLQFRLADFNGDGQPDIAAPNAGTTRIAFFRNLGNGTFSAAAYENSGGDNCRTCYVADFNRDGKPDIVTQNESSHTIGILLNTTGF